MVSEFWQSFRTRASRHRYKIAFPDSLDRRVLEAVSFMAKEGLAQPVLVGNAGQITVAAKKAGIAIGGIDIENPASSTATKEYAQRLYNKRRHRGMSESEAATLTQDSLFWACSALSENKFDGVVAGASRTTADTVRAALYCIGPLSARISKDTGGEALSCFSTTRKPIVFGFFLMECGSAGSYGSNGRFVFADCACMPEPGSKHLAYMAIEAAKVGAYLMDTTPRVAMLSFSTYGSAAHERVVTVREAAQLAKQMDAGLHVSGEMQADAALDWDIARFKGAGDNDTVAGKANVLIFPNLESGNIAYKLVERLGQARAVGPILWGLARPLSDLSRGCSTEDIIDTTAVISAIIEKYWSHT